MAQPPTPQQLMELTGMILGPRAAPRDLLQQIDGTFYPHEWALLEGTATVAEYNEQEVRRQAAEQREHEEEYAACMEMAQAAVEEQRKTRRLISENEAMIHSLLASPAISMQGEKVARLKAQLQLLRQMAERLLQPLEYQILEELPDAAEAMWMRPVAYARSRRRRRAR